MNAGDFTIFMKKVIAEGHQWGEVVDFCNDAHDDPIWELVTSIESMETMIRAKGWSPSDGHIGEAAMNTWYAFRGLTRMDEKRMDEMKAVLSSFEFDDEVGFEDE